MYCHRKFGPPSKPKLWYNLHQLERSLRWRNTNDETSRPSLKLKSYLRHSAVKVPKRKCVADITSANTNSRSGYNRIKRTHRSFYHTGVSPKTPAFGVGVFDPYGISTAHLVFTLRSCGPNKRRHYNEVDKC